MSTKLFTRLRHPHKPRNVNDIHQDEMQRSFNARIALVLTRSVGTMVCAYAFALLALLGFPLLPFGSLATQLVQWTSQTFIQLTMLSVIMVGQAVMSRKSELMAEEMYQTTQHNFHDTEEIMKHLDNQDEQILLTVASVKEQLDKLNEMQQSVLLMGKTLAQLQRKASSV